MDDRGIGAVEAPALDEITSLNLVDLDVEELENRLAAASMAAEDGWGCGCDGCGELVTCGEYCD